MERRSAKEDGMLGRREVRAVVSAALLAGLAVFVAGVESQKVVEVRVQGQPVAAPEATFMTTTTRPEAHSGRLVWAEQGDVWLYDNETGRRRALTTDGDARQDFMPHFRDRSHVTYLTTEQKPGRDPTLEEIDLDTGKRRVLERWSGWVRAYSWSPDGKTLASFANRVEGEPTELRIYGDGPPQIRPFAPIFGRGTFVDYDEARIEWSRDGRRLLLLDTALDTQPNDDTLYLLNADASNAAPARQGTWARWSADGKRIYCRCSTAGKGGIPWIWQEIEVPTGAWRALPIPLAARPSLSPDGRFLAFDDGQDTPSVHVLDLQAPAARARFLARDALAPLWLRPALIAVTDTRACPRSEDDCMAGGHGARFESAGTASSIDVTTGQRSPLPPLSTAGADADPATR
jgi:Tol biopolymer transport system component